MALLFEFKSRADNLMPHRIPSVPKDTKDTHCVSLLQDVYGRGAKLNAYRGCQGGKIVNPQMRTSSFVDHFVIGVNKTPLWLEGTQRLYFAHAAGKKKSSLHVRGMARESVL